MEGEGGGGGGGGRGEEGREEKCCLGIFLLPSHSKSYSVRMNTQFCLRTTLSTCTAMYWCILPPHTRGASQMVFVWVCVYTCVCVCVHMCAHVYV